MKSNELSFPKAEENNVNGSWVSPSHFTSISLLSLHYATLLDVNLKCKCACSSVSYFQYRKLESFSLRTNVYQVCKLSFFNRKFLPTSRHVKRCHSWRIYEQDSKWNQKKSVRMSWLSCFIQIKSSILCSDLAGTDRPRCDTYSMRLFRS